MGRTTKHKEAALPRPSISERLEDIRQSKAPKRPLSPTHAVLERNVQTRMTGGFVGSSIRKDGLKDERESLFIRLDPWFVVFALFAMAFVMGLGKWGVAEGGQSGSLINQVVYGSLYGYAGLRLYAMRNRSIELAKISPFLIAFCALLPLSAIWSTSPPQTFRNAIEMIGTNLFGYYIVARFRLADFLKLLSVTFALIATSCLALIFLSPAHGRADWGGGPWVGFYTEKNYFAATMGFGLVTTLATVASVRGRFRFLVVGLMGLCAVLLLGSTSKTALLVTSTTLTITLVFVLSRSKRYGLFAALASFVLASGAGIALAASGFDSSALFELLGKDATLTGRAEFWPGLVRAIGDRPFLGWGYNAFFAPGGPADEYISGATGFWHPAHAHNSFYQIALSVGLVGGGIFAIVLLLGFKDALVYAFTERTFASAWPLGIISFLSLVSFTEAHFEMTSTTGSMLFMAALLYPRRRGFEDSETHDLAVPRDG